MDSVRQEYRSSLSDLTFNSKPIITNLTIIAQESSQYASAIVQAIEDHIQVSHSKLQIPAMYLIDSILKNVGGCYKVEFQPQIVNTFKTSYLTCDQEDRKRLRKLFDTWRDHLGTPLFPIETMKQIQAILTESNPLSNPANMLLLPQVEMLLEKKKASNLFDQQSSSHIEILSQLLIVLQTTPLDVPTSVQINQQLQNIMNGPSMPSRYTRQDLQRHYNHQPSHYSQQLDPQHYLQTPPQYSISQHSEPLYNQTSTPYTLPKIVDHQPTLPTSPNSLVSNLLKFGLLPQEKTYHSLQQVPHIQLKTEDLEIKRPGIVFLLYEALELQCKQCGIRMSQSIDNKIKMQEHMDWHFRQNKRQRDKGKHPISREWFVCDADWINERNETLEKMLPFQLERKSPVPIEQEIPSLKWEGAINVPQCVVCLETFIKYYDDDREDWYLKNAIKDIKDKIIHFTCKPLQSNSLHSREGSVEFVPPNKKLRIE